MTMPMAGEKPLKFVDAKVIADNVPVETYLAEGVERGSPDYVMTRTDLRQVLACPHEWFHGTDSEATEQTDWGSLVDCLVLTPNAFRERFATYPETYPDSKTGEPKAWNNNANFCRDWKEEQGDRTFLKPETLQQAESAVKFLFADELAGHFIKHSRKQVMVMGNYLASNGVSVPVKGLIDLVGLETEKDTRETLGDFKTAANASPDHWPDEVFKWGYHWQAALYMDLYNAATGEQRITFRHVISKSSPPWEVGKRAISAEFMELARWKIEEALELYAKCLEEKKWPRYEDHWRICEPKPYMIDKA